MTKRSKLKPEEKVRIDFIDRLLSKTGWNLLSQGAKIPFIGNYAAQEVEIKGKFADYVLYIDRKPIAIIEAKKKGDESLESALQQAKIRYEERIDDSYDNSSKYNVPFIFAVNTKKDNNDNIIPNIKFWDLRNSKSIHRDIFSFYTPNGLLLLYEKNIEKSNQMLLDTHPLFYHGGKLRDYQAKAVEKIEESIAKNDRKILLHMATGTGKTFAITTAINRLLQTQRVKRVLFLVDRRELVRQTITEFSKFEVKPGRKFNEEYIVYKNKSLKDEEDESWKFNSNDITSKIIKEPNEGNTHVYVTTIQSMFRWIRGKQEKDMTEEEFDSFMKDDSPVEYNEDIPIDAFDLIISDECHRSIYNEWRVVLDYFDALQIGLTATPTGRTIAYFENNLVFDYGLNKAIEKGFLVDHDIVRIRTDSTKEGAVLEEGTEIYKKSSISGNEDSSELDDEIPIDENSIETNLLIPDRMKKSIEEFAKYYKKGEKALFFAKHDNEGQKPGGGSKSHADNLVYWIRRVLNLGNNQVQKITYRSAQDSKALIKKFRNDTGEDGLNIVVTVDMLSTGVDIPRIEHIFFDRLVKSRVLYEQMIGRGTRLCSEINKTHFTIYDTFGVCELHKNLGKTSFDDGYLNESKSYNYKQLVERIKKGISIEKDCERLVRKVQRVSKKIPIQGEEELEAYLDIEFKKYANELKERLDSDLRGSLKLFEDEGFTELLEKWGKYKIIINAVGYLDTATSQYSFSGKDGELIKPDDYIESFKSWVRENQNKIDALKFISDKSDYVDFTKMKELKKEMFKAENKFKVEKLNEALKYADDEKLKSKSNKVIDSVSELLSYVKYSVSKEDEFIPIAQRVDLAFERISQKIEFSIEQEKILNEIREFVIVNLHIDKKDFDRPKFRKLTWRKANETFDGKLEELLDLINENISA